MDNIVESEKVSLSDEQRRFVELAKEGNNILVDACIGRDFVECAKQCDVRNNDTES